MTLIKAVLVALTLVIAGLCDRIGADAPLKGAAGSPPREVRNIWNTRLVDLAHTAMRNLLCDLCL
jgi:hypothetical protein